MPRTLVASMMAPVRCLLPLLILAPIACSGLGHVPADFDAVALEAPANEPVRLFVENGEITSLSVPLPRGGVPLEARRVADLVFPGGTIVFEGREWGPLGNGYRIEKYYPDVVSERRSLLVAAGGEILEQTHSLPVAEAPQDVLLAAAADYRRDLDRIDVVHSGDDREYFRVHATDTMGRGYLVECAPDGGDLRVARILQAEVAVQR